MRVGFDVGPITTTRTGVGQYCYYLLKGLLDQTTGNSFVAFSAGMERPDLTDLPSSLPHCHLHIPTRMMYRLWDLTNRPYVDRKCGGLDVFHATNFVTPPTETARRVVTIHDITFLAVPELCSPKIAAYFARHICRDANEADVIVVHSEATRQDLIRHVAVPADKVVTAWPGVDAALRMMDLTAARAHLAQAYGITAPYLLFVGTLEPRKNVAGVLRALALLRDTIPHHLVLVGKRGWNSDPIFSLIENLDLGDRVHHVGFIPQHGDLAHFYSAAAALMYPTYYEGFGLPLAEAMACGCPVIASNVSSVPEVVGDAALTAAPDDIEALAQHLHHVVHDHELSEDLRRRGLERAPLFTWPRCAEITAAAYRKAVT
jgi:glycosyltransferase involved in cell wall biosynthesis